MTRSIDEQQTEIYAKSTFKLSPMQASVLSSRAPSKKYRNTVCSKIHKSQLQSYVNNNCEKNKICRHQNPASRYQIWVVQAEVVRAQGCKKRTICWHQNPASRYQIWVVQAEVVRAQGFLAI